MFKKVITIILIGLSITVFHIDEINTFKSHNSKVLAIEETIDETMDSFKSQTTIRQIC
ncbi:hypothetical protein SAMN05446037_1002237 [Anaerovirgula multivorans]|uniref:Uncharacterized protein n=1 Tax=Anaerovirgula multivorans TaxID=312168 RepID=A0A239AUF4_9FIRM|nr:hypothetical protein [Anaerovirgula multivorans]SNR98598.1 hypothetical protein SAMN05446037_1002237 [Anaerovirgula multivorans]